MRQNPTRRAALVDAAIEVLARDGARGLTFRAVDTQAAVPNGTASNYFANRDDLLHQVAGRIHQRLAPNPADLAETMKAPPSRQLVITLLQALLRRVWKDRTGNLALLELRLEATRRPEIEASLTETIRGNLEDNTRFHLESGLPGDATTVALLYFTLSGLITEHLTLPGVTSQFSLDDLVADLVTRTVPAG